MPWKECYIGSSNHASPTLQGIRDVSRLGAEREQRAQRQAATFIAIDAECMSLMVYPVVPVPVQSGTARGRLDGAHIIEGNRLALNLGVRLGPYEILSALGAGGMGEVYRARDTKLNREVALKVLADAFTRDPDRH